MGHKKRGVNRILWNLAANAPAVGGVAVVVPAVEPGTTL